MYDPRPSRRENIPSLRRAPIIDAPPCPSSAAAPVLSPGEPRVVVWDGRGLIAWPRGVGWRSGELKLFSGDSISKKYLVLEYRNDSTTQEYTSYNIRIEGDRRPDLPSKGYRIHASSANSESSSSSCSSSGISRRSTRG